jgi:hypothetical protein
MIVERGEGHVGGGVNTSGEGSAELTGFSEEGVCAPSSRRKGIASESVACLIVDYSFDRELRKLDGEMGSAISASLRRASQDREKRRNATYRLAEIVRPQIERFFCVEECLVWRRASEELAIGGAAGRVGGRSERQRRLT